MQEAAVQRIPGWCRYVLLLLSSTSEIYFCGWQCEPKEQKKISPECEYYLGKSLGESGAFHDRRDKDANCATAALQDRSVCRAETPAGPPLQYVIIALLRHRMTRRQGNAGLLVQRA